MPKQSIIGTVQTGNDLDQQTLEAAVYLISAGNLEAEVLCMTQTDHAGRFTLSFEQKPDQVLYIIAEATKKVVMGNKVIRLMTVVNGFTKHVVNELTTIASVFCFSQFYDQKSSTFYGDIKGLKVAKGMVYNIITEAGDYSKVLIKSPNGNETNSIQTVNSLCNLLALVIRNMPKYLSLAAQTLKSKHTLDVFNYIALNPTKNTEALHTLSLLKNVYINALQKEPQSYTIAIKVNRTGNDNYHFGGPVNLCFDRNGNAWITNNSSNYAVVLQPNGMPTEFSPVFGGGIQGSGYGITTDNEGNILIGNANPVEGSVTKLDQTGKVLSPTNNKNGYVNEISNVQGLKVDNDNNVWMCSYGNHRVVVYVNGDENNCIYYQLNEGSHPYDIVITKQGDAVCTCKGSESEPSSVIKLKLFINMRNITMTYRFTDEPNKPTFLGLTKDFDDNVYAASASTNNIYKLNNEGTLQKTIEGGGMNHPWSCSVDGAYNLLVANFSSKSFAISYFDVSGNALSPQSGFTLPIGGGDSVHLPDGSPLYKDGMQCNEPLMKATSANVDVAGNVWVCNNCKPTNDSANPGGDGIVIFLGLAAPLRHE